MIIDSSIEQYSEGNEHIVSISFSAFFTIFKDREPHEMKKLHVLGSKILKILPFLFYPAEFTPYGVISSVYLYVSPYVRPYEKILISYDSFGVFGIIMTSVVLKMSFLAGHALF